MDSVHQTVMHIETDKFDQTSGQTNGIIEMSLIAEMFYL